MSQPVEARHLDVPFGVQTRRFGSVRVVHGPAGEGAQPGAPRHPRIGDEAKPGVLRRVELGDVDVHEADARMRKAVFDAVVKSRTACPDPDHEVGLGGEPVRGERPGRADRAEARGMVVRQRALARLRLRHGMPVASQNARSAPVASE